MKKVILSVLMVMLVASVAAAQVKRAACAPSDMKCLMDQARKQ